MMQVRCQYCKWMFTLGREAIAQALAEAQAKNEKHHAINCPKCRRVIKLQIQDMRRRLPADYPLPEIKASPEAQQAETPEADSNQSS